MASNSLTNNNNVVGFVPLLMLSLLVLATSTAGQPVINIQMEKQVFCSPNGNLPGLVDGAIIIGAANANATLKCDNEPIAYAVANARGFVKINVTLDVNVATLLKFLTALWKLKGAL